MTRGVQKGFNPTSNVTRGCAQTSCNKSSAFLEMQVWRTLVGQRRGLLACLLACLLAFACFMHNTKEALVPPSHGLKKVPRNTQISCSAGGCDPKRILIPNPTTGGVGVSPGLGSCWPWLWLAAGCGYSQAMRSICEMHSPPHASIVREKLLLNKFWKEWSNVPDGHEYWL